LTVASALEALEKIVKSLPDLLISDIRTPEMDGCELIKTVRASEKSKLILASYFSWLTKTYIKTH